MKIVVTHASPDWDAITSVWLLKRFLPGWENADVQFVSAGNRIQNSEFKVHNGHDTIEMFKDNEVIHVDTGLGPLDHHQTSDDQVCGASLTWEYVKISNAQFFDVYAEEKRKYYFHHSLNCFFFVLQFFDVYAEEKRKYKKEAI